jgi:hypothetical protein
MELDYTELDRTELDRTELDRTELDHMELDRTELDRMKLDRMELDHLEFACSLHLAFSLPLCFFSCCNLKLSRGNTNKTPPSLTPTKSITHVVARQRHRRPRCRKDCAEPGRDRLDVRGRARSGWQPCPLSLSGFPLVVQPVPPKLAVYCSGLRLICCQHPFEHPPISPMCPGTRTERRC